MTTTTFLRLTAVCAAAGASAACGSASLRAATPRERAGHPASAISASGLDSGHGPGQPLGTGRGSHSGAAGGAGSRRSGGRTQLGDAPHVSGARSPQRGQATPALSGDDQRLASANAINPCRLVSAREAAQLSNGAVVGSFEAPLGPTCVFRLAHSRQEFTLDIEPSSFVGLTRQLRKPRRLAIRGHQAYCGRLGSQMLIVRLGGDRLLHVTAPCLVAEKLAALALSRLAA